MPQDDDECMAVVDDHAIPVRRPGAVAVSDSVILLSEEESDDDDCVAVSPPATGSIKLDCCSGTLCLDHLNRKLDAAGSGAILERHFAEIAFVCNGSV